MVKARHWGAAAALAGVLGVVGLIHSEQPVAFPLIYERLPIRSLIAVFAVPVALYPLHDWYPGFSAVLARDPHLRPVRVLGALALVALALTPAVLAPATLWSEARTDVTFAVALLTVGLIAVSSVGDYSWLVVLGVGFTSFIVDGAPNAPISNILDSTAVGFVAPALLVVAAWVYTVWGPRRRTA